MLEIWSGLTVFSVLRNTGRYLSIIQYYHRGPKCNLQQDNKPKHSQNYFTISLRTILSFKISRKWWYGLPQSPDLNVNSVSGITWRERRMWGSLYLKKGLVFLDVWNDLPAILSKTVQLYEELMLFWRRWVVTLIIDLIKSSLLFIHCILLIDKKMPNTFIFKNIFV